MTACLTLCNLLRLETKLILARYTKYPQRASAVKKNFVPWTIAEETRLRRLATKVPMDRLVKVIGRSRGAISAKAFSLRLSLDPRKNAHATKTTPLRGRVLRSRIGGPYGKDPSDGSSEKE